MKTRIIKRTLLWGKGATILILVALMELGPNYAFAGGGAFSNGISTTINDTIGATTYDVLVELTFTLNKTSQCVAIASSTADNPGGATLDNRYRFALSLDNTSVPPLGSERVIEFDDNAGVDDEGSVTVSNTFFFIGVTPGTHTISWMAKKESAGTSNMVVDDSSLSVICTKGKL